MKILSKIMMLGLLFGPGSTFADEVGIQISPNEPTSEAAEKFGETASKEIRIVAIEKNGKAIPCNESPLLKKIGGSNNAKTSCFDITDKGVVIFHQNSPLIGPMERFNSEFQLVCKVPKSKQTHTYHFSLDESERLIRVTGTGDKVLRLKYDDKGQCFDVTNASEATKKNTKGKIGIPDSADGIIVPKPDPIAQDAKVPETADGFLDIGETDEGLPLPDSVDGAK